MNNIIFFIVLFVSNAIQAITGFAGTVLAMPPSIMLIGMDNAKVVLNAMAWLSGLILAVQNYKHINYKELIKMIAFMFVGMIFGLWIYSILPADILLTIYGTVIILIALKNLFIKKNINLPKVVLICVLFMAGIMHGMFVSGGALLVIYSVRVLKNKDEFRATIAPIWVLLNTYMMIDYIRNDMVNRENIILILAGIIPLLLAIYIGNKLQKKMNQQAFLKLTYILLIISGITLVI